MVVSRCVSVQNHRMELRQLRDFLAVLDARGFTAAARNAGKSQQALSKSVQGLEAELGVQLLDRQQRVPGPTVFGRLLEPHARAALGELTAFASALQRLQASGAATVRLGASPTAAAGVVGEAVLSAVNRDPHLHIVVSTGLRPRLLADLASGRLDLCICLDNVDTSHPGLTREVLGEQAYRVVANASHPLLQPGARADLAALSEAGWVLGTGLGDVEQGWRRAFTQAGLKPPLPVLTTSSLEFCRNVLRSSQLLSVLPLQLVEAELDRGEFALVEVSGLRWQRPLALYLPRDVLPPPVLMESLRRAVAREARLSARVRAGEGPR